MPVGVRRSELDIIYDILEMDSGNLTTIRHSTNLSHTQLLKYLSFLERNGLIVVERKRMKMLRLQVTNKGRLAVWQIKRLNEILGLENQSKGE